MTPQQLAELRAAFETAAPGHAYDRAHFWVDPTTFVGDTPAKVHTDAVDTIMRLLPVLLDTVEPNRRDPYGCGACSEHGPCLFHEGVEAGGRIVEHHMLVAVEAIGHDPSVAAVCAVAGSDYDLDDGQLAAWVLDLTKETDRG